MTLIVAVLLLWARGIGVPAIQSNPTALVAGLLDAGGNVFYVLGVQHARIDVAAVLSSLYPAATVALARFSQGQPVSGSQWVGLVVCLIAVVLIAS